MARRKSDINVKLGLSSSGFTTGLEKAQDKLKSFQKKSNDLSRSIKGLGIGLASAFTVGAIVNYTKEAVNLAAEAEGISKAFSKLNDPRLLGELKAATRGTVSELNLMKAAVRADNFQVPLQKMGMFFKFATNRSIETGESVDYLVESIVNGIGRKSSLVLDNLGISATQLQEELKNTGDFAEAAANIIERELARSGDVADTTKTTFDRLSAALDDFQVTIGKKFVDASAEGVRGLEAFIRMADTSIDNLGFVEGLWDLIYNYGRLGVATDAYQRKAEAIRQKQIQLTRNQEEGVGSIIDMSNALGKQVLQADLLAASLGNETESIKKLKKEYELLLEREKEGLSIKEQFLNNHKLEFKAYQEKTEASKRLREEQELLNQTMRELMDSFQKTSSTDNDYFDSIAEGLINDAIDADAEAAEKFDTFNKNLNDKQANWRLDDLNKQLQDITNTLNDVQMAWGAVSGVIDQAMRNSQIKSDIEVEGLQGEIDKINQKYDLEKASISENIQNSRLRSQALNDLEQERLTAVANIEGKVTELRNAEMRKQLIAAKAAGIIESIINTAVGVSNALRAGPAGIPLSIVIGALGLAQTALIAKQPMPKFSTGGSFGGGMALVGERGAELIKTSGATSVYNNRQTMDMLSGGGKKLVAEVDGTGFLIWLDEQNRRRGNR